MPWPTLFLSYAFRACMLRHLLLWTSSLALHDDDVQPAQCCSSRIRPPIPPLSLILRNQHHTKFLATVHLMCHAAPARIILSSSHIISHTTALPISTSSHSGSNLSSLSTDPPKPPASNQSCMCNSKQQAGQACTIGATAHPLSLIGCRCP